ncbi:sialidase family protein [Sphingobacterium hotanense]|uniref:sialidase family protein n=1 Tax=Sphingobacterium hotanense TaxID=649196 RepID=UPI0011F3FC78|nr:sialidase family protein [Sphingobacterium hotanense]
MKKNIIPLILVALIACLQSCQNQQKEEAASVISADIIDSSFVLPEVRPFAQAHASTLVHLQDDTFLIAWFGGTKEKDNDVGIWLTKGDGKQWSAPVEIAKIREVPHWNPVLFKDANNDIILFFKVGSEISIWETWYIKSSDQGATWSTAQELVAGDKGGRGPVRNKPIVLSDGSWLAGASNEDGVWRPFVDISKDQGKTWEASEYLTFNVDSLGGEGMIQPTLWESDPGNVHMLLRSSGGYIYRSDSKDYGKTWNPSYKIDLPNPNSGIDLAKMEDGLLCLLYNPDNKNWGSRADLRLAVSTDNGKTWKDLIDLEKGKEGDEYSYPAIIQWGDHIAMTYTWNRSNIAFKHFKINDK